MNKSTVIVLAVGVLFAVGTGLVYWGQDAKANLKPQSGEAASAPVVNVVQPKASEMGSDIQFSARLAPSREASLFARSSGFVQARYADIGTRVKAGEVLARISAPELEASLNSARAAQRQREAELLVAKRNRERVEPLGVAGAVSAQQVDELTGMEEVAKANLAAAKAEVLRLQSEVAYLTLTAPFDGVITERNIDRGDRVSPTDSMMLYRIINSDVLRVQVDVPQPQLFRIDPSVDASLTIAERPGQSIPVNYKRSSQELRSESGTVRIEYEFDNRELALAAGLNAMLKVVSNGKGSSVTVPANTIVYRDGGATLVALNDANQVEFRKVTLGKNYPTMVEVLQGAGTQDRIVVNPNALLKEGQVVELAN
ncbi:efflux RND transporter periplasmic adaptor subunit [Limnobacter parvus]|uniref:Efflux RND transporter periplasmic adaptor subunit n=1 Tax=Limnobacter parvus TaxID=2939690 RepID=A0ABT1XKL4_9BURK|nr:efflux RND transporter periplasmic adaptor subunit [Limnobacter parvus]MCR2747836.1 efflux RND transporter periplasmic adaptor subunit [Limnobacter parvus]